MHDNEFNISPNAYASLVSLVCPKFEEHKTEEDVQRSLIELKELMRTLEIPTVDKFFIQKRPSVDPATIIGSGKLQEIADEAKALGSDLLVFDVELTASQIRNIKEITGLSVVDRCHVILEIFAQHAHTREAKIQIEIARYQYLLPRLSGFWTHLSRQGGGVGVRGGEGEQQIELDRRIIRQRIEFYKEELKEVARTREQQRKKRSSHVITAALVGYTNAGKSSLMNRLCQANVLEENKLFATLDSTFRTLNPDSKPPMVLIDTVGFISNLPNTLIDGFKTTLESALEADLLIIVCDISDPYYKKHLEVTEKVLSELGLENKERFIVFNKKDLLNDKMAEKIILRTTPKSFLISSYNKEDMSNLRNYIIEFFLAKQPRFELFVPYENGEAHSKIIGNTNILNTSNHEKGIFYRVRVPEFIFHKLNLNGFVLAPHEQRPKEWLSVEQPPVPPVVDPSSN